MLIEDWSFDRREAGAITGFTEVQITKMQDRYDLFDVKSQGRGSSMSYHLSDLMKLAAIRELKNAGLPTRAAVDAIGPFSVYGTMLHNDPLPGIGRPGVFVLTMIDSRLVAMHDPRSAASQRFEIDTWALFARILPHMVELMKANASRVAGNLDARIEESLARISEIRALRHRS